MPQLEEPSFRVPLPPLELPPALENPPPLERPPRRRKVHKPPHDWLEVEYKRFKEENAEFLAQYEANMLAENRAILARSQRR